LNFLLQTTVIDGAGFGQPGTTIQAAFGQMELNCRISLIKPCTVFVGLKAAKSTREFYQRTINRGVIERVANAYTKFT
jgi:hypothetical protein